MEEEHDICDSCGDPDCGGIVGNTGGMYAKVGRFKYLAVAGYSDIAGSESFRKVTRTQWGARRWVRRKAKELVLIRTAVLNAMEDGK